MIKCCIFDLDGTILDTISTITHFVNLTLQKFGYGSITEEQCKYFVGNGARVLIERTLAHLGVTDKVTVDTVLDVYDKQYKSNPYYLTSRFEGMREILLGLRDRGIKLAVISNKQDSITKEAVEHFYPDLFDFAVGGREGVPLKPAPDAPLSILRELGATPEECAFVGDTSVDIETGLNISARLVIGVLWGFRKIDELGAAGFIASHPEEILTAIDAIS